MELVDGDLAVGELFLYFFFFQAEDGIRDVAVTVVQTCALPISSLRVLCPSFVLSRPWFLGAWSSRNYVKAPRTPRTKDGPRPRAKGPRTVDLCNEVSVAPHF